MANLGILGTFKYYDFFVASLREALASLGWHLGSLDLILPIGISFYTFQSMSYTIDIYRRRLAPTSSLLDFALYVTFFPQLVAGPIVRAAEFLPQLATPPVRTGRDLAVGARRFVIGLFKKVFVADNLARLVDEVFANGQAFDTATVWLAVLAYTVQIYCDFSGYSDMAIGTARMLGYRFPRNFDFPYLARSMSDFWRRWHISLSTWLRDYLYISLGGNRRGPLRTGSNLMITMILGGLWHGAAWTFVFWGFFHGAALVGQRLLARPWPSRIVARLGGLRRVAAHGATLLVVVVGWVFFRAPSFGAAIDLLTRMAWPHGGIAWLEPLAATLLVATAVAHGLEAAGRGRPLRLPLDAWYTPTTLATMIGLVLLYHPQAFNPFIYFQF